MRKFAKLNSEQLKFISEILGNLGLVFFVSMVVPAFNQTQDLFFIATGLVYAFMCWFFALVILRKEKI